MHAEGVALDIAEGMLRHARPQGGARYFVAGDAERLPLRDAGLDLIFSSLALQWCEDFASVLGEARRVLRRGGTFAFSSLCVGTLQELRDSWQAVDGFTTSTVFAPWTPTSDSAGTAVCNCSASRFAPRCCILPICGS